MKKKKNSDLTNFIPLLKPPKVLRKRGETRKEQILGRFGKATVWDRGKKVIENGELLDEEWLEKKLAKMRTRGPGHL